MSLSTFYDVVLKKIDSKIRHLQKTHNKRTIILKNELPINKTTIFFKRIKHKLLLWSKRRTKLGTKK